MVCLYACMFHYLFIYAIFIKFVNFFPQIIAALLTLVYIVKALQGKGKKRENRTQ